MSGDEVSRRALLGATVGLSFETPVRQAHRLLRMSGKEAQGPLHTPLPAAAAGPPPRPGEDWDKALAAFRAAEEAVREIEAATAGCSLAEEEALLPAHEAACAAMEAALGRLMLAPAPDVAAFAAKLELFFEHALEPFSVEEDSLTAIRSDLRRLSFDRLGMSGVG